MLVSSREMIQDAQKGRYAIGAFNVSNLETIKAVIGAAEVKRAPIIMQTTETSLAYAGFPYLVVLVKEAAKLAQVPVALHLDHGKSIDTVIKCLNEGYTSVMIDGSSLEFEKNVELTKKVVELAHQENVPVEGEIGKLVTDKDKLADPIEARNFVEATGVDYLAAAIGTVHGVTEQKIDLDLLSDIRAQINIPLVLHGGSGNSDEMIRKAISYGICKINIHTEIRLAYIRGVKKGLQENPNTDDHRAILKPALYEMQKVVEGKIELFGSAGKV